MLKPPTSTAEDQVPDAEIGWKPLLPDLHILLPFRLRPWKQYSTSSRRSSSSYAPLLRKTLLRTTLLS